MNVATRADVATPRGCKTGMLLTAEILIFDPVTRSKQKREGREREEKRETESSGYQGRDNGCKKPRT